MADSPLPASPFDHQQPSIDRDRDDPEPCSVQTGPNGRRVCTHASRYMVLGVEKLDLGWRVAVVLRGQGVEGGRPLVEHPSLSYNCTDLFVEFPTRTNKRGRTHHLTCSWGGVKNRDAVNPCGPDARC